MERICFSDQESGEDLYGYILEQTSVAGITYLLVTQEEEADSDACILKEVRGTDEELFYTIVEDDAELGDIARIFSELLEDVDILK